MHEHVVQFDLADCRQELSLSLLGGLTIVKELLGEVGEEDDWVVVKSFVLAAEVDAVNQADVSFFRKLNVDKVPENLQRVGLRELLQDKGGLLWVLSEHLVHQRAAHDGDEGVGLARLLKKHVHFLDIHNHDVLVEILILNNLPQNHGEKLSRRRLNNSVF